MFNPVSNTKICSSPLYNMGKRKINRKTTFSYTPVTVKRYISSLHPSSTVLQRIQSIVETTSKSSVLVGLVGNVVIRKILAQPLPDAESLLKVISHPTSGQLVIDHMIRYGFLNHKPSCYATDTEFGVWRQTIDDYIIEAYKQILPDGHVKPDFKTCGTFQETMRVQITTSIKNNLTVHFYDSIYKWSKQFIEIFEDIYVFQTISVVNGNVSPKFAPWKLHSYVNRMLQRALNIQTCDVQGGIVWDEQVLDHMLYEWKKIDPSKVMSLAVEFIVFSDVSTKMNLVHLPSKWSLLWIPLYNILQEQLRYPYLQIKALALFPHFKTKPHYILIGKKQLSTVIKTGMGRLFGSTSTIKTREQIWTETFPGLSNLHFERIGEGTIFDQFISTNGVSASIHMVKQVHLNDKSTTKPGTAKKRKIGLRTTTQITPISITDDYTVKIGADPGKKDWMAVAKLVSTKDEIDFHSFSSKKFHHDTWSYRRYLNSTNERKRHKTAKIVDLDNALHGLQSRSIVDYLPYAMIVARQLDERYRFYSNKKYLKIKMVNYSLRKQVIGNVVKKVVNFKKRKAGKTLFVMGNASPNFIQRAKGHVGGPLTQFKHLLQNFEKQTRGRYKVKYKLTDEFRTTQLCRNCNFQQVVTNSPDRTVICKKCHKREDRDHNAAGNMLKIGNREEFDNGSRPNCFVRNTPYLRPAPKRA